MSSAKGLAYALLDVFAEAPFEGNPVAVVFGAGRLAASEMQAIARETNLSETTFVLHEAAIDGAFEVRIFTPGAELPYAGHPTLGTAAAIRARLDGCAQLDELVLALGIGRVRVRFAADGLAWLESPRARFEEFAASDAAAAVLGLPVAALDPGLPVELQAAGHHQLFVPLRDRAALEAARIDAAAYDALRDGGGPDSVYAFARGARDPRNDFSVRLFAPAVGVPEDPGTGSAAGFFGAYLVRHRVLGERPLDVRLERGDAVRRPSLLRVCERNGAIDVGGRVIEVGRGEWL